MPAPDSVERPFALVVPEHSRLVLAAIDDAAAGEGLRPGLPLAEARALVPELATAPFDPAGDGAALTRLAEWCGRYTPWAAVDGSGRDAGGVAGILLDVTGCAHLFGGEAAMLDDLIRRLGHFGFTARAGLAESAGGAWAVARFAAAHDSAWRMVPPGALHTALASLPPDALRLDAATLDLMARLGLRRIGDLYDLPPVTLAPRFGPQVARRLAQALGCEAEPISPRQPVPSYLVRRIFAEPIATPDDIARGLAQLLDALTRRLETEQRGARRLEFGLYRVDGTLRRLTLGTSRAQRDPAHLKRLFAEHLDKIDPGFGIEVMTLAAPLTEDLSALQLVLSDQPGDGTGRSRTGDLAALIDRLGSRLGLDQVIRPVPRESYLPERAVAAAPALGSGAATRPCPPLRQAQGEDKILNARPHPELVEGRGRRPAESTQPWAFRPRPVRLLPRPEPIEAIALLPDHAPARFRWRRLNHAVVRAEGPERIEPEWWLASDQAAAQPARDYFRVEAEDGRRYWLYRAAGSWFLHGVFA